jgi:hypothetical protein
VTNPYTAPQVNLIVGQNTLDGVACNRGIYTAPTAQTICYPASANFDHYGNLYVAEGVYEGRADMPGNKRIVEYDKLTIDIAAQAGLLSEPTADRVYAVSNFTTNPVTWTSICLPNTPCNPIALAFDVFNRMVVLSDAYYNLQNKRIYFHTNPLRNTGYVVFNAALDAIFPYSMGQGGHPAFSATNQLYVQDHTWNRVMVIDVESIPQVMVSRSNLTLLNTDSVSTYQLGLELPPQAPVTIQVVTDGKINVSPTELIFTEATWNIPQEVIVTQLVNSPLSGLKESVITHTVSSLDSWYHQIAAPSVIVTATYIGYNHLTNSGFETAGTKPRFADGWTGTRLQKTDKRNCSLNRPDPSDLCIFKFGPHSKTGPAMRTLFQYADVSTLQAGDTIALMMQIAASKLKLNSAIEMTLYYSGNREAYISQVLPRGTYGYQNLMLTHVLPEKPLQIRVRLIVAKVNGWVKVDNLRMVVVTP